MLLKMLAHFPAGAFLVMPSYVILSWLGFDIELLFWTHPSTGDKVVIDGYAGLVAIIVIAYALEYVGAAALSDSDNLNMLFTIAAAILGGVLHFTVELFATGLFAVLAVTQACDIFVSYFIQKRVSLRTMAVEPNTIFGAGL